MIPHCDHEDCDLGSVHYFCPSCKTYGDEYGEAWFDRYKDDPIPFECEHCHAPLELIWDKEEKYFFVQTKTTE